MGGQYAVPLVEKQHSLSTLERELRSTSASRLVAEPLSGGVRKEWSRSEEGREGEKQREKDRENFVYHPPYIQL